MYAFIVEDTDSEDEGAIGIRIPPGSDRTALWLPLGGR